MDSDVLPLNPLLPKPSFFIVGAVKAGTTSLHTYLSRHPDVFMSALKEPHYFSLFELQPQFDNFVPPIRDPSVYQGLFNGSEHHLAVGESSPSYLCDEFAASRIKKNIPNAKIVVSLRNPVQRAYSHYLMEFHRGRERLAFGDAIAADQARPNKAWGSAFQYVELGLYTEQVNTYFKVFGRDRVKVVLFEEMIADPRGIVAAIATFLGVDPTGIPSTAFLERHNHFESSRGSLARAALRSQTLRRLAQQFVPRSMRQSIRSTLLFRDTAKPRMRPEERDFLARRYEPDLQRLENLLGRDLEQLREKL